MDLTNEINMVRELLDKAKDILVVTHDNPTHDSLGSTLALYLGLVNLGKRVTVAAPEPVTVELSNFIGVNKITQDIGKKNFVISLDYVDGSIEKVSYNIEGDKFNLVIEHRPSFEPFTPDKVHYSTAGASADLIFIVDTIHLGGLRKLYETEKALFAGKPVVNIDRHSNNSRFGQVNILNPQASSTAELVGELLSSLGVRLTQDIATNLLNALFGGTSNFQNPQTTAAAFELAAACLKAGGKKFKDRHETSEELPKEEAVATKQMDVELAPKPPQAAKEAAKEAPADWLKPKIFKSSNLL